MVKVLVVEDDKDLNAVVVRYLRDQAGFDASGCSDPEEAEDALDSGHYDIIISDIMMPGMDGYEFARRVRSVDANIPIIFMTARDDFESKKEGFSAGIDDYMVKPINLDELVFRMKALLRRSHIASEKRLTVGNLVLDAEAVSATVDGEDVPVTLREFQLLFKFLSYPNKTFSRSRLMEEFWDEESDASFRAVDVYITKLRDKFSSCDGFHIQTVHGLGYKAVLS